MENKRSPYLEYRVAKLKEAKQILREALYIDPPVDYEQSKEEDGLDTMIIDEILIHMRGVEKTLIWLTKYRTDMDEGEKKVAVKELYEPYVVANCNWGDCN